MSVQEPRLLVTGANGQLGRLVIDHLLETVPPDSITAIYPNVNSPVKSGRRLALLAAGQEGGTTGKYFSNGREIRSSELSYNTANSRDLWDTSAEMTSLSQELEAH